MWTCLEGLHVGEEFSFGVDDDDNVCVCVPCAQLSWITCYQALLTLALQPSIDLDPGL